MSKWLFVSLLVLAGLGLWVVLDPSARSVAIQMRTQVGLALAQTGVSGAGDSFFAPISRAMEGFANSVSNLFSSATIHIEVPSVQIPH